VHGAFITDIADSFDYENNNVFDFRLRISYEFTNESATLAREKPHPTAQYFTYFPEYNITHVRHSMVLRAAIGLYKDLELNLHLPLIFFEGFYGNISPQAQKEGSTLRQQNIVKSDSYEGKHTSILGDMSLGFRWGIFNDSRTPYRATWEIGMAWTIPTGKVWDPSDPNIKSSGGGVGRGSHVLTWHTTLSKRVQFLEPYVKIWYSLFLVDQKTSEQMILPDWLQAQTELYNDLLQSAAALKQEAAQLSGEDKDKKLAEATVVQDRAEHKQRTIKNAKEQALDPSHQAGFILGSEFILWENKAKAQRIAFDLRFVGIAQFEGRDYTILTGLFADFRPAGTELGKDVPLRASLITDHEQKFTIMMQPAFQFHIGQYGYIRLESKFGYTFPFFVTHAKRGIDKNMNGFVDLHTDEVYPFHVRELDGVGKRIQQNNTFIWAIQFYGGLTF
jgi:hypothetical protein